MLIDSSEFVAYQICRDYYYYLSEGNLFSLEYYLPITIMLPHSRESPTLLISPSFPLYTVTF